MLSFVFFCLAGSLYLLSRQDQWDVIYDWKWALQGFAVILALGGIAGALGLTGSDCVE